MTPDSEILRFDRFLIDLRNRRLAADGEEIELGSRYFDALVLLARHPGDLVPKDRFMDEVWRGIPVTDEALTQCIRTLRRALGDDATSPRFIATVPKHGYRFLAEVQGAEPPVKEGDARDSLAAEASRLVGSTTLGGVAAGVLGGLAYGALAVTGGAAGLVTLLVLTTALAVLGAGAIGIGMAAALRWRPASAWTLPLGGMVGGMLIGALGSSLGLSGLLALTGTSPVRVMGLFEGAMLGLATGLALLLGKAMLDGGLRSIAAAGAIGAFTGLLVKLSGGWMYGDTLTALETSFPESQIEMARVGAIFGETGFYMFARLVCAMLEGAVFTASLVAANVLADRK